MPLSTCQREPRDLSSEVELLLSKPLEQSSIIEVVLAWVVVPRLFLLDAPATLPEVLSTSISITLSISTQKTIQRSSVERNIQARKLAASKRLMLVVAGCWFLNWLFQHMNSILWDCWFVVICSCTFAVHLLGIWLCYGHCTFIVPCWHSSSSCLAASSIFETVSAPLLSLALCVVRHGHATFVAQ